MPEIEPHGLRRLAERILCAAGMQLEDAVVTAECLVMANLRGVDTHGVFRLAQHVETLRKGEVNASPHIRVVARHGATALIDADGGYGFRPSLLAVEVAVEMASSMGAGIAGVRNSHHFGMAAIACLTKCEGRGRANILISYKAQSV